MHYKKNKNNMVEAYNLQCYNSEIKNSIVFKHLLIKLLWNNLELKSQSHDLSTKVCGC